MWPGLVPDGRGILTIASGFETAELGGENRPRVSCSEQSAVCLKNDVPRWISTDIQRGTVLLLSPKR